MITSRFLLGEMADDQNERGGAVVDHGGGFAPAGEGEATLEISGARAASAAGDVVFEIAVAGRDLGDAADGGGARAVRGQNLCAEQCRCR